tara:strand:+ start:2620 stop:4116 length:1497 start_codon:yes stop_codon:yes gene_type:complete
MHLDFSTQAHFLIALAPELVLSVFGMVVLLLGVGDRRRDDHSPALDLGWIAVIGVAVAFLANSWLYGISEVGNTSVIALDSLALFANWIFIAALGLSVLISIPYVKNQKLQAGEFYGLLIYSTVGLMIMAAARDLILIFLGLEIMSIAVYALTAMNRRDKRSAEAGLKYFILGAFSTGFFLYGIALIYGATGSTNISHIASVLNANDANQYFLAFGIILLAVGFAFKVSMVPFHMWTPDVYQGAPLPVTAFMAVAVKAGAFVALLRVFSVGFEIVHEYWQDIFWWLAVLTMIAANLIALVQADLKRILAYSAIAHAGYLMVAIVSGNDTSASGLLFYLLVYTFMSIGAFGIMIIVSRQSEEFQQVDDYAGFGWEQPVLGILFSIFLLSLAGFPGTGGFMAKIFLLQGALEADLIYLSIILVVTTVISYWYYLRVAWFMWMYETPNIETHSDITIPTPMWLALVLSIVLVVYLGIFPDSALEFARSSIEGLSYIGPNLN